MLLGTITEMPNEYSRYARIRTDEGTYYTVEPDDIPEDAIEGREFAFKVELSGGSGGLAYAVESDY